jgi:hypothetical protein
MSPRQYSLPLLPLILALLPIAAAPPAHAATVCKQIPGIGAEIAKFLDEVAVAQAAGQGSLPLRDALFGVTDITADGQKALDGRPTVELAPHGAGGGDFVNRGPAEVTVEGIFAEQETYFRMPPLVKGRYTIDAPDGANPGGVTLHYDPNHTVDLGEPHVGMRFFKGTHHTVITRDGVAFFLDDNAGPDPDRCYRAAP